MAVRLRLSLLLALAGALLTLPPPSSAGAGERPDVLILHSYHADLGWTASINRGLLQTFAEQEPAPRIHVEYLDTKRHPGNDYLQRIDELLRFSLSRFHFDLVVTSDNDAFDFALRHRNDLFADIPIVFCGVNNFRPELLAGHSGITGVAERPSFRGTIEVALQLHPGARELIFIGRTDDATGASNQILLDAVLAELALPLPVQHWNDLPATEVRERAARLERDQLLFLTSNLMEGLTTVYSFEESAELLRAVSPAPLYGFWDFFIGHGIVGGKLVSGEHQGAAAARMAGRILAGATPAELPVISGAANAYLFDDRELRRFGVSRALLPPGAKSLYTPPDFYRIDKTRAWGAALFAGLLLLLAGLQLYHLRRRRRTEAALRQSEERLRLALEGSRDGMWDYDPIHNRIIVDDRWWSMLGYSRAEIAPYLSDWEQLVHPDDLPTLHREQQRLLTEGLTSFSGEFRLRTRTGGWKWILSRGMVVSRTPDGRPARLIGTHKDLTLHKEAEARLRQALTEAERSRDKIEAILKSMGDALIVFDARCHVDLINRAAEQLLGMSRLAASGLPAETLITDPPFLAALKQTLDGQPAETLDLELLDRQRQETRTLQARFHLVALRDQPEPEIICTLQDVTRARESERLKSEFIATAAHELRTPLTAIQGFAELLLEPTAFTTEERREFLAIIIEKSEALSEIVDDLLDLSRIESGHLIKLSPQRVSLGEIAGALLEQFRTIASRHHFNLARFDGRIQVLADVAKVGQVFENILSNAVKYSPAGGEIAVATALRNGLCEIRISDQGIGMTPAQMARVFDKFYRAEHASALGPGLGLGMSIARRIIEAHGGGITLESELGKGTSVCFSLPLAPEEA